MTPKIPSNEMLSSYSIAIVGLGPKGFYCLERLAAEFNAKPLRQPLHVHVFNRSSNFGASPIYDPKQPEYILLNDAVGHIDLWRATGPSPVGSRGLNFVDWYNKTIQPPTPLSGSQYLSRAIVGRYLIDGFRHLLDHLPSGLTVSCHAAEVVDLCPNQGGYKLEFLSNFGQTGGVNVDKVVLATGHSRLIEGPDEKHYQEFANRHSAAGFIPFVYPVVESMSQISATHRVAMKGVGLTFIDAVLELTEGRGGRFKQSADGSLSYIPSGEEPRSIIPFCRSGLPMTPKAYDLGVFLRPTTFFTEQALQELKCAVDGGKLDFSKELWHLFELEMELHYYRVVMGARDERKRLEQCGNDAQAMRKVIDDFLRAHPEQKPFDYGPLLDPIGNLFFETCAQYNAFIASYMEQEIARAYRGQAGCGAKAAIDIWSEVYYYILGSVLKFGGLTPESHQKLLEYYFPRLKRVVFGPPIINIKKLLALLKSEILDFGVARNPRLLTNEVSGCFELHCDAISGAVRQAEVLVDARYPAVDIRRDATPLYRNLQRRGMVRAYQNRPATSNATGYYPGAIDMTPNSQFVVDCSGVGNEDLAVIGIPTEGNLAGNISFTQRKYASVWAAQVMAQLRRREQ